jgi:hypothetical protein
MTFIRMTAKTMLVPQLAHGESQCAAEQPDVHDDGPQPV